MLRGMAAHDQKPLFLGFIVSVLGMLTIFSAIVLEAERLGSLYYPTIIAGVVIWAIGQACIHGPMRERAKAGRR